MKWESIGKCGEVGKAKANEKLVDRKKMIREGRADEIDVKIPSFESFADTYSDIQFGAVRPSSHTRLLICLKHLKDYFGIVKLSTIRPKDVESYKRERKGKVSDGTVNRELSVLKHLFNVAKTERRFFGQNPVTISKLIRCNNVKERILKQDEQARLLEHCNPQLKAIVLTALNTGMRKGEILTLKWDNVDFNTNLITLDAEKTKSNKSRHIPINPFLRTLLLEQKAKTQISGYVFLNSHGKPYKDENNLKCLWMQTLKNANIAGFRFHDLRHTFATRAIESGASIIAVKEILGHSDIKTTVRYLHPDNSIREAVNNLENYSNGCSNKPIAEENK
ncbi:MAG TPA: site-specific integrase [Thermodesulfobacteriota bacterium]|nr:site-specific integrase [Thermodesulfobacteriota bacterium]